VILLETGFVPQKNQIRFDFPIFKGEAYDDPSYWSWQVVAGMGDVHAYASGHKVEYWVSVASPVLDDTHTGAIASARVKVVGSQKQATTVRLENLSRQARVTFDAEKPSILFKTILRGMTKYLASRGAEEAGGDWAKFAVNLFGAATESADTRSWLTLPEHVNLARLSLAPGVYDLDVELIGYHGEVLHTETIYEVDVRPGDWTFVSRRVF